MGVCVCVKFQSDSVPGKQSLKGEEIQRERERERERESKRERDRERERRKVGGVLLSRVSLF